MQNSAISAEFLGRTLESFLADAPDAVALENGELLFDFSSARYSVSGEGKCVLHIWSDDRNAVRRVIGYVAQKSGVDPESTGRENLTLQGQLHGMGGQALAKRVDELLERFQLCEAAARPARGYSGGMQRKLDIAMGLIHQPKVLFLDEPSAGLDPQSRIAMWEAVRGLREEGITVVLTTHYMEEADELCDRVAIIDGIMPRHIAGAVPLRLAAKCPIGHPTRVL